jgi:hypothetical protein
MTLRNDPHDLRQAISQLREVLSIELPGFIALCRTMGLLTQASVAIDGSKFKAVNNRDKNSTRAKMERRMAQIEESVARYLRDLTTTTNWLALVSKRLSASSWTFQPLSKAQPSRDLPVGRRFSQPA